MAEPRIKILLEAISRSVALRRSQIQKAEPGDRMCEGVNTGHNNVLLS